LDGGSVDIDVTVDAGGVRRGMQQARDEIRRTQAELRGIQKQIQTIEQLRSRVPADVFGRSFYAKDLAQLRAQRTELQAIVNAERQATQAAQQRSRVLGGMLGRGGLRSAGVAGAVGIGAYLVGQNLQQLGGEGSAASRAGGFLSNLVSGNVVGAIRSAQEQVKLTDDQVKQLGTTSTKSSAEVDRLAKALTVLGQVDAARSIRELRAEINATNSLNFYQQSSIGYAGAPVMPNDRGGLQGVGAAQAVVPSAPVVKKGTLNLWRRQQTALAATTPGTADDIAETRKNIAYLQRLTKDKTIEGQYRTNLYTELRQQQQALAALTAKPPTPAAKEQPLLPPGLEMQLAKARTTLNKTSDDLEVLRKIDAYLGRRIAATKDINRKTALLNQQASTRQDIQAIVQGNQPTVNTTTIPVNPAGVLGALGQGPFLTSPVAQFAQQYGYRFRARDYLRDIRQQVQAGARLDRNLNLLRKRGLGETAISELAGQGLAGADMAAELAKAPKALIRQYSRAVANREEAAARVQAMTATIETATIVVRNGRVAGIDRNGDGKLSAKEATAAALRGV